MQKLSRIVPTLFLFLISSQQSFFKAAQTSKQSTKTKISSTQKQASVSKTEVSSKNDAAQKSSTPENGPYWDRETERPFGKRWEGNLTRLERFRAAFYRTFFPTYTEEYLKDVMVSGDTSFDKYDSLGLALKIIGAATVIGFVALMGLANKQASTPGTFIYNSERIEELEKLLKEKEKELEEYKELAKVTENMKKEIDEIKQKIKRLTGGAGENNNSKQNNDNESIV